MLFRGFRVTFGRVSGALVWISNDLRGRSGCLVRVLGDLRVRFEHYAVVVLQCRFRLTFGGVLNALARVSGDFRVTSGCPPGVFAWVPGDFRVPFEAGKKPTRMVLPLFPGAPRLAL